jgi:hypothetical protein
MMPRSILHDSYAEMRPNLCTGAIVLFKGTSPVSRLIEAGQLVAGHGHLASRWTHVGIIYHDPVTDAVLLLESTTLSKQVDILTKQVRSGVQLVSFSRRLAACDAGVAIRIPTECPGDEQVIALGECVQRYKGVPYERSRLDLLAAVFDRLGQGDDEEDCSSLFCSELVALCLQAMGWLPAWVKSNDLCSPMVLGSVWPRRMYRASHNRPADEWVPADFAHSHLSLSGTSLSHLIHLK